MKNSYIIPLTRFSIPSRVEEPFVFLRNTEQGTATVMYDGSSFIHARKNWNQDLEASAARSTNGKNAKIVAIGKMCDAYDKAHLVFSSIYNKSEKIAANVTTVEAGERKIQELKIKKENVKLQKYVRNSFHMPKPTMADAIEQLEEECKYKFASLFGVNSKKSKEYINEKKNAYLAKLIRNWEELQTYHEFAQDVIEAKENYRYIKVFEKDLKKLDEGISEIETDIANVFINNLRQVSLPFILDVSCEHDKGELNIECLLDERFMVPEYRRSIYRNNYTVSPLLDAEKEEIRTEAMMGAAVMLLAIAKRVSKKIDNITLSFWTLNKRNGLFAVCVDRNTDINFHTATAKYALMRLNLVVNWVNSSVGLMDRSEFLTRIEESRKKSRFVDYDNGYISLDDANLIIANVPSAVELKPLLEDAVNAGVCQILAGRKYVNMLKELRS